jgi:hypothetical protein
MNREELLAITAKYKGKPSPRKQARQSHAKPAPRRPARMATTSRPRKPEPPRTAPLSTEDMHWEMTILDTGSGPYEYKALRIGSEPFVAIRADGPEGTSNRFYIHDLNTGKEVRFARGNRADIYRALKRTLAESIEHAERERQQAIYETERAHKEEEEKRINHALNHGEGFYIVPYYSIPEIAGDDEPDEDLYGEPESDCLGPFHRHASDLPSDRISINTSIAEDRSGVYTPEELEEFYRDLARKLPAHHPPFVLIEAESRKDALARRGYVWMIDGLSKGPPVDPRQTGFWG